MISLLVIFLVIVFVLVLIVILIIWQCKLTIGFTLKMDNLVSSVYVTIYLLGKFPAKKIMVYPRDERKKNKDKPKKIRKKADLNQLRESAWVLIKLFYKSIILKKFKLHVREGTGDACQTALIYGLLWSLTGFIPGRLFNNFDVEEKEIRIDPDFKEKVWKLEFDCIFSLKIVNIISIVKEITKINLKNRKGGGADVRSSDRRSHDYSNAKY